MPKTITPQVEKLVLTYASQHPELGQFSVAESVAKRGHSVSPSGVRAIWRRHGLETVAKRLERLSKRTDSEGGLTSAQAARLVRVKRRASLKQPPQTEGGAAGTPDLLPHIFVIAAKAFQARGYAGASLKDIAELAGLTAASLYHYVSSKEDLLMKVHHAGFVELNSALDQALADVSDPVERLRAACQVHLETLLDGNAISAMTGTSLFVPNSRKLKKQMLRDRRDYENRFRGLVAGVPLRRTQDPSLIRLALLGAMNWSQLWYQPGGRTPAEIADQFVDALLGR